MYRQISILILVILTGFITVDTAEGSNIAIFGRFRSDLDPDQAYNPYEFSLGACFYPRLMSLDADGNVRGEVARAWKFEMGGLRLRVSIDPASGFQSEQIAAWLNAIVREPEKGFHRGLVKEVLSKKNAITVDGEWDVLIRLRHPYQPLIYLLSAIEFQIPKPFWPKTFAPIYDLKILAKNREYNLQHRHERKQSLSIDVIDDRASLLDGVRRKKWDVVLGLTPVERSFVDKLEGYKVFRFNSMNALFMHLRRDDPVLGGKEIRRALAQIVREGALEFAKLNEDFQPQDTLLPRGLMPPSYYAMPYASDYNTARADLSRALKGRKLKAWIGSNTLPEGFKNAIQKAFTVDGVPIVEVLFMSGKDFLKSPQQKSVSLVFADGGSFFPDPDSFLKVWSMAMPEDVFPFPGRDLMRAIERVRGESVKSVRLEKYENLIQKFTREFWAVPIYSIKEIALLRADASISLPAYRYGSNLCRGIFANGTR